MAIHLIRDKVTPQQMTEMLEVFNAYIKLAVDIERGILAGGGSLHADCEAFLLEDGSKQEDIWGSDWIPDSQQVHFEALINIRPKQNNRAIAIQDSNIRARVKNIVQKLLGNVQ